MDRTKGQAAMEYLMTYGWAILVIVIVLASLLYLGIFNLNPPEVCTMPSGMTCTKSYLSSGTAANAKLDAVIVNGLQKTIVITAAGCSKSNYTSVCTSAVPYSCGSYNSASGGAVVPMGSSFRLNISCMDDTGSAMPFSSGDNYNGRINVEYYFKDEGSGAVRRASGNLFATAG